MASATGQTSSGNRWRKKNDSLESWKTSSLITSACPGNNESYQYFPKLA
jgi:hypothetical protein